MAVNMKRIIVTRSAFISETLWCLNRAFVVGIVLLAAAVGAFAQEDDEPDPTTLGPPVEGQSYEVPDIRVQLTDEETGLPLKDLDVLIEYCWRWHIIKPTPETARLGTIRKITVKGRTDARGMVLVPRRIIVPTRPVPPPGARFSDPSFWLIEIVVHDQSHFAGLFINVDEIDKFPEGKISDVQRSVPRWPIKPASKPAAGTKPN
jgi:hypothetical protein